MVDIDANSVQVAVTALRTEFREPMSGLDYAEFAAVGQGIMIDLVLADDPLPGHTLPAISLLESGVPEAG